MRLWTSRSGEAAADPFANFDLRFARLVMQASDAADAFAHLIDEEGGEPTSEHLARYRALYAGLGDVQQNAFLTRLISSRLRRLDRPTARDVSEAIGTVDRWFSDLSARRLH